jgi:hypothetical protein
MEYIDVLHKQRVEVLSQIDRLEEENDEMYFKIDECEDEELKQKLEKQTDKNEYYLIQLDDELVSICLKIDEVAEGKERGNE